MDERGFFPSHLLHFLFALRDYKNFYHFNSILQFLTELSILHRVILYFIGSQQLLDLKIFQFP